MVFKNIMKTNAYKVTVCSLICLLFSSTPALQAEVKNQSKSAFSITSSVYNQENFADENYQISDASLDNKYLYRNKNFLYRHDLGALLQIGGDKQAYDLRLSEAYFSYKFKNNIISVGRKKQKLSQVDEEWNLGLVNPLFNHDYLNPEQMGAFGLQHTFKKNNFYIQSFVSYVHLPSQQPKFDVEDEKITSINPWFSLPPEQVSEQGGVTPVRYEVEKPEAADVILQGSVNLKLGYKTKKNWLSLAYANKPSNDFHKMYRFSEELSTDDYFVSVEGKSKRHELYMIDMGAKFGNTSLWTSYLKDKPDATYEKDRTWQETLLDEQSWLSAGVSMDHFSIANLSLSASYLKRLDKEVRKDTLLKYDELDSILSRSYFERSESVQLKVKYKYNINKKHKLSFLSRYEYSIADKSQLTMAKVKYGYDKLSLFAEGGIITADEDDKGSFFSKHKGNDYIKLGAGYVF